jgi:hypothetical protein
LRMETPRQDAKAEAKKSGAKKEAERARTEKAKEKAAQQQPKVFTPSRKFAGARAGFVFKKGKKGVGYYPDVRPPTITAAQVLLLCGVCGVCLQCAQPRSHCCMVCVCLSMRARVSGCGLAGRASYGCGWKEWEWS